MEVGVALTAVSKVLELLTVGLRGNFFYEFKLILTLSVLEIVLVFHR